MFSQRRRALLGTSLAMMVSQSALAQSGFPSRPVRVIVPYPAGGIVDQFARIVIEGIGRQWASGFVVEPLPGAASNIGTRKARQSEPDGQTWLISGPAFIANPYIFKEAGWDVRRDFTIVGTAGYGPLVLVTHPASGLTSMAGLIERAKAQPGKLNAGTSLGSSVHINLELMRHTTGIDVTLVPYPGAPQISQALAGGQIDFSLLPYTLAEQLVQAGRMRAIALASPARSAQFPNVPTFAELGHADSAFVSWYYFAVPRATPEPIAREINAAMNKALTSAEVVDKIRRLGGEPGSPRTLAELELAVKADDEKIARLVKVSNMRAE